MTSHAMNHAAPGVVGTAGNRTASSSRLAALRSKCALLFALMALSLSIWIVAPAPNYTLLPIGVGAPEVCGWLIVHAFMAIAAGLIDRRTHRAARAAVAVAIISMALAASPLLRFGAVAKRAGAAMTGALGTDYLQRIPVEQKQKLRPSPLVASQLFFGIPIDSARITRKVPVASPDGVPLTADIYQPTTAGPHPLLVQVYGGAWQRGDPSSFGEFAQYMAARGYVVFAIDYRHAPKYRFPVILADIDTALAWVVARASQYDADTSRMAIIGRSAGAHLAMLAAYRPTSRKFRAVINYYGPVDLVKGYREIPSPDPLKVRSVEDAFLGGPPESAPELYREASPISYATRPQPPTLLLYGGRDHIVLPQFGEQLANELKRTGTTAVHVEIPWGEHAFDSVPNGPSGQLARYLTERFLAWAMVQP